MRYIITCMLLILYINSFEQTPSPAPVAFNYQRDFKMILEKTKDKGSDLYYQKLLIRLLDND